MKRANLAIGLIAAGFFAVGAGAASAQASRTWVSGTGDDANPCGRTAPCKTFAGAISKTAPGGEIDALDPGGFGALTITKTITLDGGIGVGSVLAGGTNGIVIAAGPNDVVTLRNLSINGILGAASPGLNGVRFVSGAALHIEHCNIMNFSQNGINFVPNATAQLDVTDTFVTNSTGGILVQPTAGTAKVSILRTMMNGNITFGLRADSSGGGIISASVTESQAAGNSTNGIVAVSGAAASTVVINRSVMSNNGTNGVSTSGAAANIFVGGSTIQGNVTAANVMSGSIFTYGNNFVNGNGTNGTFTGSQSPQ